MRAVDADAVKEIICNHVKGMRIQHNMIYEVENLPTINVEETNFGKWIPADRPPKPEEYVLLSFGNFSVPVVGMYREDEGGGAYYVGDDDETCISQGLFVNAWMPLTEPYRGGEE